jgi:hypothetical protein
LVAQLSITPLCLLKPDFYISSIRPETRFDLLDIWPNGRANPINVLNFQKCLLEKVTALM